MVGHFGVQDCPRKVTKLTLRVARALEVGTHARPWASIHRPAAAEQTLRTSICPFGKSVSVAAVSWVQFRSNVVGMLATAYQVPR